MEESTVNPMDEFDPEVRVAVDGLIHLGALSTDVDFCGHTFGIRTLRTAEELAASIVLEPYRGTIQEPRAWASAQVGLALTHIDGDDQFCPAAGPNLEDFARARLRYVTQNWFWPTIDTLFVEYTTLLERQVRAVRAWQDLSTGALPTSPPLADSSSRQGISVEEMLSELHETQS